MKKLFTKGRIALLVIFSVLIIDQIIKVWIKTHVLARKYTCDRLVLYLFHRKQRDGFRYGNLRQVIPDNIPHCCGSIDKGGISIKS